MCMTAFEHANPRVLVAGDPPLTENTVNDLTELFEWALDGSFNPEQRNTLVQVLTSEWESANRPAVEDTVKLAEMGAGLRNLSPAQRLADCIGFGLACMDRLLHYLFLLCVQII